MERESETAEYEAVAMGYILLLLLFWYSMHWISQWKAKVAHVRVMYLQWAPDTNSYMPQDVQRGP